MSIVTLQESLDFLDIGTGYFEIKAENNVLNMSYNGGANEDITCSDGTYEGSDLATELESKIDAAFTISSTVSYNSSTYKFTIAVPGGDTITIDVSASDAALDFGFTSDPTAAVSITSDQAATEDPTAIVQTILNGVDAFIKGYCRRDFESTAYKEYYNGKNRQNLFLKQCPVISVARLSIGRINGLKVNNSATATYATVSVTSTGVVLNKDGTTTTLLFADNATLTLMAAAIGGETNWSAEVLDANYASFASTELIEAMGLECLNTSYAYLDIPEEPEDEFEVYHNEGYIYKRGGFVRGHRNIRIDYTAGYASGDMPDDLKLACMIFVKFLYQKREEEAFTVSRYSLGGMSASLLAEMPSEVRVTLDRYQKRDV